MISSVSGKIISKGLDHLVIETGGIGYKVFTVTRNIEPLKLGDVVILLTHLVVRDDALVLYGFVTTEELSLFNLLVSVSGVGPKIALSIINSAQVKSIESAITLRDPATFTAISGVGKKTAERIIVELKGKLGSPEIMSFNDSSSEDLISALTSLGYNRYEIRQIISQTSVEAPLEERVKQALKLLS